MLFYSQLLLIEDLVVFLTSSLLSCCVNIRFWTLHLEYSICSLIKCIYRINCEWKKASRFSYGTGIKCGCVWVWKNFSEWNISGPMCFRNVDHSTYHITASSYSHCETSVANDGNQALEKIFSINIKNVLSKSFLFIVMFDITNEGSQTMKRKKHRQKKGNKEKSNWYGYCYQTGTLKNIYFLKPSFIEHKHTILWCSYHRHNRFWCECSMLNGNNESGECV